MGRAWAGAGGEEKQRARIPKLLELVRSWGMGRQAAERSLRRRVCNIPAVVPDRWPGAAAGRGTAEVRQPRFVVQISSVMETYQDPSRLDYLCGAPEMQELKISTATAPKSDWKGERQAGAWRQYTRVDLVPYYEIRAQCRIQKLHRSCALLTSVWNWRDLKHSQWPQGREGASSTV